jgi:hypothetical protein
MWRNYSIVEQKLAGGVTVLANGGVAMAGILDHGPKIQNHVAKLAGLIPNSGNRD